MPAQKRPAGVFEHSHYMINGDKMSELKLLSEILSYDDFGELILDIYSYPYRMKILDDMSHEQYRMLRDEIVSKLKEFSGNVYYVNSSAYAVDRSDDTPHSLSVGVCGNVYEFEKRTVRFSDIPKKISGYEYEAERSDEIINLRNIQSLDRFFLFDDTAGNRKSFLFDIYRCPRSPALIGIHDKYGALAVEEFKDKAVAEIRKFSQNIYAASRYAAFAVPFSEENPGSVSVIYGDDDHIFTKKQLAVNILYSPETEHGFFTEAFHGDDKISSKIYGFEEYYEGDIAEIDSPQSIGADRVVIYFPDGRGKAVNHYKNYVMNIFEKFTENSFGYELTSIEYVYHDSIFEHLDVKVSYTNVRIGYRIKKDVKASVIKKIRIIIKAYDSFRHERVLCELPLKGRSDCIVSDVDVPWNYPYFSFLAEIIMDKDITVLKADDE